jgi:hypothetical protein
LLPEAADVVFLARSAPRRIMSGVVAVGVRALAISAGTGAFSVAIERYVPTRHRAS